MKYSLTCVSSDKINELEIIEAAKAANGYDFISRLKNKNDTLCGDRAVQLSGGGIAYRYSPCHSEKSNNIAVLDKGTVVEKGTLSSLLTNGTNEAYYSLVSLQSTHNTFTSHHNLD